MEAGPIRRLFLCDVPFYNFGMSVHSPALQTLTIASRQFTPPNMSQFIAQTLKNIPGVDPRLPQRAQAFSALNDGPAETAARLAGLVQQDHAKDDSPL